MKHATRSAVLIALASVAGMASAQNVITTASGNQWEGFTAGVNLGGAWNTTCNTWQASSSVIQNPAILNALNNRNCPNGGTFVGGAQIGYNFQYEQIVWGFGLDYDAWGSKTKNASYTVPAGTPVPAGTYEFSGKANPNGFFILGPRVGYAIDNWLPYVRVGGVFTSGTNSATATFTPTGAAAPTASFAGSKNAKNSGYGVGIGVENQIVDQWSIKAEYTYVSLGKSSSSTASCMTTTAGNCNVFNNLTLENFHNSFTASVFRVGINYRF